MYCMRYGQEKIVHGNGKCANNDNNLQDVIFKLAPWQWAVYKMNMKISFSLPVRGCLQLSGIYRDEILYHGLFIIITILS